MQYVIMFYSYLFCLCDRIWLFHLRWWCSRIRRYLSTHRGHQYGPIRLAHQLSFRMAFEIDIDN